MKNIQLFTAKGGNYAAGRPSYPGALADWLIGKYRLSDNAVIADIACGTGKFTRLLAERRRVIGVEPNADMLNNMPEWLKRNERLSIVQASAENTGLADSSVDMITVAQAYHWFDAEAFRREAGRILKKDGIVALIWNDKDNGEFDRRYDEICMSLIGRCGKHNDMEVEKEDSVSAFFSEYETNYWLNPQLYDRDGFISLALSSSYSPAETDGIYSEYVRRMNELFDEFAADGKLAINYKTVCYSGKTLEN